MTKTEKKQLQDGKVKVVSQLATLWRLNKATNLPEEARSGFFREFAGSLDTVQMLLGYEESMRLQRLAWSLADVEEARFWDDAKEAAWIAKRLED